MYDYVIVGRRLGRLRAREPAQRGPRHAGPADRGRRQRPLAEHQDPGRVRQAVPHQARLGLRDRARAARRRPLAVHPARQEPRRLELDERDALRPRPPARLRPAGRRRARRAGAATTCCRTSCSPRTTSAARPSSTAPAARCGVSEQRSPRPLEPGLLDASEAAGIPRIADYNGPEQDGASMFQVTQKGRHAAGARPTRYLRPALKRPNLEVLTGATVLGLELDGDRAVGVRFRKRPRRQRARARRARGDPLPPARSARRSCCCSRASARPTSSGRRRRVRHELPGVGRNLQDHPFVTCIWEVTDSDTLYGADKPKHLAEWLLRRIGPLTSTVAEVVAFVRTPPRAARAPTSSSTWAPPTSRTTARRPTTATRRDRARARLAEGARPGVAALRRPRPPSRASSPTRSPSPTTSTRWSPACALAREIAATAAARARSSRELKPGPRRADDARSSRPTCAGA